MQDLTASEIELLNTKRLLPEHPHLIALVEWCLAESLVILSSTQKPVIQHTNIAANHSLELSFMQEELSTLQR